MYNLLIIGVTKNCNYVYRNIRQKPVLLAMNRKYFLQYGRKQGKRLL